MSQLSKSVVAVVMNADSMWTLKPWHVQMALLSKGVFAPEESIVELPSLSGPDKSLDGGEFIFTLSVTGFVNAAV